MREQAPEKVPATVSATTQQAGEAQPAAGIRTRWDWAEPAVWTERMLTALEDGVKGGKWFRLIDKVYALPNLRRAFARVKANQGAAGVDHVTVEEFERDLEANLALLSNIYLDALDHTMAGKGFEMVRYADDFVVLCGTPMEAQQALEVVRSGTAQAGLTLHPDKTRIVDATQPGGFDFLGYHFERGMKWPRRKSARKLRDTIRALTRRTQGQSLQATIVDLNRVLGGWFEYFKHRHKTTFAPLDGWVRMRLRSILRRRRRGHGPGRAADHQRWPNAYFAECGLFSRVTAHATACQSSCR